MILMMIRVRTQQQKTVSLQRTKLPRTMYIYDIHTIACIGIRVDPCTVYTFVGYLDILVPNHYDYLRASVC